MIRLGGSAAAGSVHLGEMLVQMVHEDPSGLTDHARMGLGEMAALDDQLGGRAFDWTGMSLMTGTMGGIPSREKR